MTMFFFFFLEQMQEKGKMYLRLTLTKFQVMWKQSEQDSNSKCIYCMF